MQVKFEWEPISFNPQWLFKNTAVEAYWVCHLGASNWLWNSGCQFSTFRHIIGVAISYHVTFPQPVWYSSFFLFLIIIKSFLFWWWLTQRLSKCQLPSTTALFMNTQSTQTIIFDPFWPVIVYIHTVLSNSLISNTQACTQTYSLPIISSATAISSVAIETWSSLTMICSQRATSLGKQKKFAKAITTMVSSKFRQGHWPVYKYSRTLRKAS